jgi:hypothetical protein
VIGAYSARVTGYRKIIVRLGSVSPTGGRDESSNGRLDYNARGEPASTPVAIVSRCRIVEMRHRLVKNPQSRSHTARTSE